MIFTLRRNRLYRHLSYILLVCSLVCAPKLSLAKVEPQNIREVLQTLEIKSKAGEYKVAAEIGEKWLAKNYMEIVDEDHLRLWIDISSAYRNAGEFNKALMYASRTNLYLDQVIAP